jgi:hypothetical protein
MHLVEVSQIKLRSVFKLGYLANLVVLLPLMLVVGLDGMAGGEGVSFNGQPAYGGAALATALVLSLVFPLFAAGVFTIGVAGLRLLGRRGPTIAVKAGASEEAIFS